LNTKIHMPASDNQRAIGFLLSGGEASDAKNGRLLPDSTGRVKQPDAERPPYPLMDRAYEDWDTRRLAFERGYSPAVPPQKNRKNPWKYDTELYKQRNEAGRLFRRLKGFRRTGRRYDKPGLMFSVYLSCFVSYRRLFFGSSLCEQALVDPADDKFPHPNEPLRLYIAYKIPTPPCGGEVHPLAQR
jgi:transposase